MKDTIKKSVENSASDLPCDESRRTFLRTVGTSVLAMPIILRSRESPAESNDASSTSPPTIPWHEELPEVIEPLVQKDLHADALKIPQEDANTDNGECGRARHQRWDEFFGNPQLQSGQADTYEFRARAITNHVFNPAYPPQLVWQFVAKTRGGDDYSNPVIFARYGRPVILRLYNELPKSHGKRSKLLTSFGTPEISMHMHNLHTPSESDGFPGDYFSGEKSGPTLDEPGLFKDHFFPNVYAGYDEFQKGPNNPVGGDIREALGTVWYHDHTIDFTAPNASRGLAGFYLLFDEIDSGDEHDTNPKALRLPSHPYDYPLAFQSLSFNKDGIHIFDQFDSDGTLGDKITVNGEIEPVLRVVRRKYRLRLLNVGPSRSYQLYLVNNANKVQKFTYIANDGNLLTKPLLNRSYVRLVEAERGDIVVDFSQYPLGTELYIVNRLEQTSNRKPDGIKAPGTRLLKFIVNREPAGKDVSEVPNFLRPIRRPTATEIAAAPVRSWKFARKNGMWTINDRFFNVFSNDALTRLGSYEIWEFVNPSGGWSHPVHIHLEEAIILKRFRSGKEVPIAPTDRGRKDTFELGPNESVQVFLRFRDFIGKYVMHCHNLSHEDHAMMVRWDVVE